MEAEPKLYRAIMVSSTFTDLEAHRREVIEAIHRFGFHANVMEYSGARSDADVIGTSLEKISIRTAIFASSPIIRRNARSMRRRSEGGGAS